MKNRKPDLARALQLLNVKPPRYMLVDAITGKDMREAQGFEVEHIRRNANFSGVSMLGSCTVTFRRLAEASRG